jgi:hypothetical protein
MIFFQATSRKIWSDPIRPSKVVKTEYSTTKALIKKTRKLDLLTSNGYTFAQEKENIQKKKKKRVMLHIIPLFFFSPLKIDVALKITIGSKSKSDISKIQWWF